MPTPRHPFGRSQPLRSLNRSIHDLVQTDELSLKRYLPFGSPVQKYPVTRSQRVAHKVRLQSKNVTSHRLRLSMDRRNGMATSVLQTRHPTRPHNY